MYFTKRSEECGKIWIEGRSPSRGRRFCICCIHWRSLTAVILFVIVCTELEAVIGSTHQISPAARVTVMLAPVTRPVTVTLTLITRGLRGAATPFSKVPAPASLTWKWKT